MSAEQQARDLLERMGFDNAQSFTAGDVVELANLYARIDALEAALRFAVINERNFDGFDVDGVKRAWFESSRRILEQS